MKGVKEIKVNGEIVPEIKVLPEGTVNEIEVVLG